MSENILEGTVEFTYPEGFKEAAEVLTMFPEEKREAMMGAIAGDILFY